MKQRRTIVLIGTIILSILLIYWLFMAEDMRAWISY